MGWVLRRGEEELEQKGISREVSECFKSEFKGQICLHLYEVPTVVKFKETETRTIVA